VVEVPDVDVRLEPQPDFHGNIFQFRFAIVV
jgi:hypothetical protein